MKTSLILFLIAVIAVSLPAAFLLEMRRSHRIAALAAAVISAAFILRIHQLDQQQQPSMCPETQGGTRPGVTLILLNYDRPHNTRKIVKQLEKDDQIDRILVLNGKKEGAVWDGGSRTEYREDFENNKLYGGGRRFLVKDIQTDYVAFLDDDILPEKGAVSKLVDAVKKMGGMAGGGFPRLCNKVDGYKLKFEGEPDTVLIGFSALSTDTIRKYQNVFDEKYAPFLKKTHGNCEDLTLATFVRDELGEAITHVKEANIRELESSGGYSANKNHLEVRNNFCKNL